MTRTLPTPSETATLPVTADSPAAPLHDLRRPAPAAGVGLLVLAVLAGAADFAVVERLVTPGNATRTADDIMASAGSFRLGTAALLALFGLHLVLIGHLAYTSGYLPRALGVLLAVAGVGYLVDSFAGLLLTDYPVSVSAVTCIGEALFLLWLMVKGRKVTLNA